MSRDINHPAVKQTFESTSELVDKIHKYGFSKGKHVYVGTWPPLIKDGDDVLIPPYTPPDYDYIVVSPISEEVLFKKLHKNEMGKDFLNDQRIYGRIHCNFNASECRIPKFASPRLLSKTISRGTKRVFEIS